MFRLSPQLSFWFSLLNEQKKTTTHTCSHISRRRRDSSRDRRKNYSNDRRQHRRDSRSRSRSRDRSYKKHAANGREEHGRDKADKEVERWQNDKFAENNERRTNPFSRPHFKLNDDADSRARRSQNYDKQTRRQFEHDIMDTRRTKRELIGKEGTSIVWAKSPPPSEE